MSGSRDQSLFSERDDARDRRAIAQVALVPACVAGVLLIILGGSGSPGAVLWAVFTSFGVTVLVAAWLELRARVAQRRS